MTLRISRPAQADIENIFDYLAQESPRGARTIVRRIVGAFEALLTTPYMGRPGRMLETRELVIPRTRYVAIYQVTEVGVTIVRVLHGRQQWPP